MRSTGTPAPTAPAGFTSADRCETCSGTGQVLALVTAPDGGLAGELVDGVLVEATTVETCDDCEGVGFARPVIDTTTPAGRRLARQAEHLAYVAETGDRAACGGAWCTC